MAFDQNTRNRLQRFVGEARSLLSDAFTRQMQNDYGLDPTTGEVSELNKLSHLDDTRQETARLLRDTLKHYLASSPAGNGKEALCRIVREQAFTILNRLCALRMAEARGIIIESIGNNYNSQGFKLYTHLAGNALGETGHTYQWYLFSLFDEFAIDLPVLFDRHSPMGRLFPRESKLLELLTKINDPEIVQLWAEDETIGWIYQYFNSVEERRQMRAESQAPRNSRELAVRNQFFTPRYVVEFLNDNTLGRIWYEMTKGNTTLKDSCRYLVRRPNEIFLAKGEDAPEQNESSEELRQEELLKQPVYITFRPMKDPREILMLDPACGSMHFGLYAFDLFERIYNEAWEMEESGQWTALSGQKIYAAACPLHTAYQTKEDLLRDVPRLIIEHNIHGIDIDPRAMQIAGLSLWLRAQRSWKEQGLNPADRPQIRRSNIVCAEPMPGEEDMLKEFTATLKPRVLGQLVEIIFEKMGLAGEAGSLLKIEEEIEGAIEEAREEFNKELLRRRAPKQMTLCPTKPRPKQLGLFDFTDLSSKTQFRNIAEKEIMKALRQYAEQAEGSDAFRRRLFAEDTAKGFAFIDLCQKRFDVVLMNPPFGETSRATLKWLRNNYCYFSDNLYCAFFERMMKLSLTEGFWGAITDRSYLSKQSFEDIRRYLITSKGPKILVDLGWDVLDANVETAIVICNSASYDTLFTNINSQEKNDKKTILFNRSSNITDWSIEKLSTFRTFPFASYAYTAPAWVRQGYRNASNRVDQFLFQAARGMAGANAEHLYRLIFELPLNDLGWNQRWTILQKGSPYSPFYFGPEYALLTENLSFKSVLSYGAGRITNREKYGKLGLSFGKRTDYMYAYLMRPEQIFSVEGQAIFPIGNNNIWQVIAIINSSMFQYLVNQISGQHKLHGYINAIHLPRREFADCSAQSQQIWNILSFLDRHNETACHFISPKVFFLKGILSLKLSVEMVLVEQLAALKKVQELKCNINSLINTAVSSDYDIQDPYPEIDYIKIMFGESGSEGLIIRNIFFYLIGITFGRWDIRYATGEKKPPKLPDPFDPLPACPPGMLQSDKGLPAEQKDVPEDYPLRISWDGILVDDEGNKENIVSRVHEAIEVIWKDKAEAIEQEACQILGVQCLRDYFSNPAKFFADHLKRYSKSRRQAPIYWHISTPSCSYTIWIYYHRLTDQTLYTCVNDFIEPKLKQVSEVADELRRKIGRSNQEEKELEKLTDLEHELKDFRDELLRIARFWKPNLNDGVQITAAPLWKLFQQRPWQNKLKETWEKLENGDYDWAHLALNIWPERVIRKSHQERSLAIAHYLEDDLWEEIEVGTDLQGNPKTKWAPKTLSEKEMEIVICKNT